MFFSVSYIYDLNGNVLTYIDKNGTVVYNTYDGLNRVLNTRNSKDDTSFAYTYDGAGQLIKVNGIEYTYNLYGELVKQTENGISQNYSYNSLGNRSSYSLANGDITEMQIAYGYDKAARLSKVSSVLGDQLYTYDNANRLLKSTNSISGIGSEYTYFPSGNIKSLTQYNGTKATDSISYQYNRNGFRTVESGINYDKVYTYDNQNRLHEAFDGKLLSVYNYDDFGNIKTIHNFAGTVGSVTNYTYDRNNRLTARFVDGIKTEYSYDRQGNLVSESDEIGSTAYHYNGFNRLTNVYGNNLEAKYTYDHTGLRTSKNVNGVHTRLINDGQNVVAQYIDGKASHFYRGSSLIGYTNSQNEVNFYQFNAHGDVVSVLDCFGNTVRNYDYDAFGKQKNNQDAFTIDDNPFRYCGEYFDDETGLIYLRARYYDSDVRRFINEDPIKDGLNWYVYCGNNPTNYVDPSGTDAYIYYIEEYENEAKNDKKKLMEHYKLTEEEVYLVELTSKDDFINSWNSLDDSYMNIDAVIINAHGSPTSFGDNKNFSVSCLDIIADLNSKDVGTLVLYMCNGGHYDYKGVNIAAQFARKTNTNPVVASDGTVSRISKKYLLFGDWNYISYDDNDFKKLRNEADSKSSRDNKGWTIYQRTGEGNICVYPSGVKWMTLKEMLTHSALFK